MPLTVESMHRQFNDDRRKLEVVIFFTALKIKKKCFMILTMKTVALIVSLLLAGTIVNAAEANSIIYLRPIDALILDPWQANDVYSSEVIANIFEGLVRFKKNSTAVEPCLASAWVAKENGKRWIFTLRRGVTFHNGRIMTAADVVQSLQSRLGEKQNVYQRSSYLFSSIASLSSRELSSSTARFIRVSWNSTFMPPTANLPASVPSPAWPSLARASNV